MFAVKLRTPSRANYEHFHVYLACRRQTGTVVTRQTYDRAPRLTRPPTAHISRGVNFHYKGLISQKLFDDFIVPLYHVAAELFKSVVFVNFIWGQGPISGTLQ